LKTNRKVFLMFSAPIHTLEQRAAFIDLLARRCGDVSPDVGDNRSTAAGVSLRTSVRVRAGRVVPLVRPVSIPSGAHEVETVGLELAALANAVAERLHETEIPITQAQSERYEHSLQLAKPRSRRELYFRTRAIFLTDSGQFATFNRVFAEVFGAPAGADRHRESEPVASFVAERDEEACGARAHPVVALA
jgi:hypothetical protein